MKQCSECGTFSPDDTMFCAVCGKRFSDAIDVSSAENNNIENNNTDNYAGGQNISSTTHPEVLALLQRVTLFLEDSEFDRADEYCERILDCKWLITRPFNKNLPALRLADFYYLVLFFLQLSGNTSDQGISFFNSSSGIFSLGYLMSSFSRYVKYS